MFPTHSWLSPNTTLARLSILGCEKGKKEKTQRDCFDQARPQRLDKHSTELSLAPRQMDATFLRQIQQTADHDICQQPFSQEIRVFVAPISSNFR